LSWSKSLIRKWFNVKNKSEAEDYYANELAFGATWNVGGKCPPSNMSLDDWLHASPATDIYVLGFQEIVPLNPSNILGSEDNGPAKKWISLIRKTLNNRPGICASSGNHTPSPAPKPIVEMNADFEGSSRYKDATFFHRKSFQVTGSGKMVNEPSSPNPQLDRRYSVCDRVIFGNRTSNCRLSNYRPSDYRHSDYRPSDYRPSDYRPSDYRPSDFSRWGSSEEDFYPGDSPSTMLFSPMTCSGSTQSDNCYRQPKQSRYCLIVSKQMVGVYLTVWIRKDLREHVRNVKVSCVGRGLMGYLGNKGSIAVSMLLHQTSFCFVCTHLTSGQKEGDELRRNADVMEILKKTRFPRISNTGDEKSPETIVEHDRVIWLGDLNYRMTLPYRSVRALVEMQNWRVLLEKDQLRSEQRRGHVFSGWNEGNIYFPPTYKYSHNSDRYSGDDMHPNEKRRTPAWCDRILWHGSGLHQLSYVRAETRFSDHRPVYSIFWAEVECIPARFRRSMSCSSAKMEVADLLPYSHGYTELCFF
ncbi:hypothetical protein KSS87_004452, partial [Heliosperma pusillum]